jgi:hypothetical protein
MVPHEILQGDGEDRESCQQEQQGSAVSRTNPSDPSAKANGMAFLYTWSIFVR